MFQRSGYGGGTAGVRGVSPMRYTFREWQFPAWLGVIREGLSPN